MILLTFKFRAGGQVGGPTVSSSRVESINDYMNEKRTAGKNIYNKPKRKIQMWNDKEKLSVKRCKNVF